MAVKEMNNPVTVFRVSGGVGDHDDGGAALVQIEQHFHHFFSMR